MSAPVDDLLGSAGMSAGGLAVNGPAIEAALGAWDALDGRTGTGRQLFVPGRIEVLGKHTDYAGGSTLTCAVERGLAIVYSPRRDGLVRLVDARMRTPVEFQVDPAMPIPAGRWSTYPMTAARRLARNFGAPYPGADIAFHSTLPRAAGLSSSSALVTAIVLVLVDTGRLSERDTFKASLSDPLAFATQCPPHNASVVTRPAHTWRDAAWMRPSLSVPCRKAAARCPCSASRWRRSESQIVSRSNA